MSFSSEVRKELCAVTRGAEHCRLAELSAIVGACGHAGAEGVVVLTESEQVARRYNALLRQAFSAEGVCVRLGHNYAVTLAGTENNALAALTEAREHSPPLVKTCCKRAYISGSFIACGTMSDPKKTYHIEFSFSARGGGKPAPRLAAYLKAFGLHPRTAGRGTHTLVYVKESDEIVDLLNIMEAHRSLLTLENVRIEKELRNNVNRSVNFETANLKKTVDAAVGQLEDIRLIARRAGLAGLSPQLEETARLRLKYGSLSLKEIGAMMTPPVGKSGVNHRLRKISEIAENLRQETENKI